MDGSSNLPSTSQKPQGPRLKRRGGAGLSPGGVNDPMDDYYSSLSLGWSHLSCKDYLRCCGVIFTGLGISGIIVVSLSGLIIGPICLTVNEEIFNSLQICQIVQKRDHALALFCCGLCVITLAILIFILEKRQKKLDNIRIDQMNQNYYKFTLAQRRASTSQSRGMSLYPGAIR